MWHWNNPDWNASDAQREVEAAVAAGLQKYPEWQYPLLRCYLGFSGQDRIEGWKRVWVARRMGLLPAPTTCSVCLTSTQRGQYHCENYSRPLEAKPICRRCHLALHKRFRNPDPWMKLVSSFQTPGCWFRQLTMDPIEPAVEHASRCIKWRDVR